MLTNACAINLFVEWIGCLHFVESEEDISHVEIPSRCPDVVCTKGFRGMV